MEEQNFSMEDNSRDLSEKTVKRPGIFEVSALFSVAALLLFFVGSRVQHREFKTGILITEFILILLPPLFFLMAGKYDMKKVLRLSPLSPLNALIVFSIMLFAPFTVGILNFPLLLLIKKIFGRIEVAEPPIDTSALGLLVSILIIAGSAGICEEVLFRGTIQRGFERLGPWKGIFITAILFGLMHGDFQKLFGITLLGILIGFIVYRTDSIFAGMLAHFTNNALAVCLQFGSQKFMEYAEKSGVKNVTNKSAGDMDAFFNLPPEQMMITFIVAGGMLLFFLAAIGGLIYAFICNTRKTVKPVDRTESEEAKRSRWGLVGVIPGVALIGFIYFAEGLKLLDMKIPWVKQVLTIMGLGK